MMDVDNDIQMLSEDTDFHVTPIDGPQLSNQGVQDIFTTPEKIVKDDVAQPPHVGMRFKSLDEALISYENYGWSKGFSVVRRSSRANWSRYKGITYVTYACSHYGSHSKVINEDVPNEKRRPNTSTVRGQCEARMNVSLDKNTFDWKVTGFVDDHNHDFATPSKVKFFNANRKLPDAAKSMVEIFQQENLPVHKVKDILGGDAFGFSNRACWNHLRDVRQRLDVGDAQWVHQYFQQRTLENPQFYYAIQCDGEGRAVNFFWVDARSRMSYKQFGDVVSFDTTYKTNKYHLPFAPFTGVNHHFQTIQFGCALLQDETEASFIWLFETWKDAMGGVEPVSMITDSDPAMKAAIPKVFPNTRHRLCYWHIKKNFGVNLSHLYYKKSSFKREVKECLKFTFRIDDFERKWEALLVKYDLTNNSWLKGLYEDRASWVPVYNRTAFFAGMNSTGRSEGINSFFKDYIRSTTNLKEFVEKYEKALKKIEERELEADFMSEQRYPLLATDSYLLNHAKTIYTKKIFEKFKKNWNLVEKYKSDISQDDKEVHIVKFKKGVDEHWLVRLNQEKMEGTCECHFSEFVGIPCAHLLKVFSKLDMVEIPDYFIKQRWLKRANRFKLSNKVVGGSQLQSNAMEFSQMCHEATQLACIASLNEERRVVFFEGIRELCEKISNIDVKKVESDVQVNPPSDELFSVLLDPRVVQTKGRYKEGKAKRKSEKDARIKHPMETSKKGRICTYCEEVAGHNVRTCPDKLEDIKNGIIAEKSSKLKNRDSKEI